jgi:hypothetical protein
VQEGCLFREQTIRRESDHYRHGCRVSSQRRVRSPGQGRPADDGDDFRQGARRARVAQDIHGGRVPALQDKAGSGVPVHHRAVPAVDRAMAAGVVISRVFYFGQLCGPINHSKVRKCLYIFLS